jgi:limonene-1,2-epoxide hydrolase
VTIDPVQRADALLAARRFLDAFNERDFDALRALITDDVELRTVDGRAWRGVDGARDLLDEARKMNLRVIGLHRGEHAEERDGSVWVELRVRELIGNADIERIADFEIRQGRIASFALRALR